MNHQLRLQELFADRKNGKWENKPPVYIVGHEGGARFSDKHEAEEVANEKNARLFVDHGHGPIQIQGRKNI